MSVDGKGIALSTSQTSQTSNFQKSAGNDLIIGMAKDLDSKNLAVFGKSLRKVYLGFRIDISSFHPSTSRWPLINKYLEEHGSSYSRIWMLDVRDSYFQSDPFEFVSTEESNFHVFNGVESIPISKCSWNSGWIKDCFGDNMLNSVGRNGIICSGVSAGSRDSVLEYTKTMSDIILHAAIEEKRTGDTAEIASVRSTVYKASKFPSCERNGVDQGIHNVLVHNKLIPNIKVWSQASSPVANIQAKVAIIRNQVVYNKDGGKVAVVHQYDRFPELQKYLFEQYVDWVDTGDLSAEWAAESACDSFHMKKDWDMFKGVCDITVMGGATSAAACCPHCEGREDCKAFTFANGLCYLKSCSPDSSQRHVFITDVVSAYLK
eukprot:gene32489-42093_t